MKKRFSRTIKRLYREKNRLRDIKEEMLNDKGMFDYFWSRHTDAKEAAEKFIWEAIKKLDEAEMALRKAND